MTFSVVLVTGSILGWALLSWVALVTTLFALRFLWLCSCLASPRMGSCGSFLSLRVPHFIQHNFLAFSSISSGSNCRRSDRPASRMPTTILSRSISSRTAPYSQVSIKLYNAMMHCSADSLSRWHRQLNHALSKITFRRALPSLRRTSCGPPW